MQEWLHKIDLIPDSSGRYLFGSYESGNDHSLLHYEFYWREVWHLIGGILAGSILFPITYFSTSIKVLPVLVPTLLVLVLIGLKEFLGDASEQPDGWDFKNIVDTAMWTAGTALSTVLLYKGIH
jgi:hypothetical protein